jgi:hypothetical protein
MSIKTRLEKLEAAAPDDVAARLGGTDVVERLADGRYQLPDKREVNQSELDAILRGCTGKLLVLGGWRAK